MPIPFLPPPTSSPGYAEALLASWQRECFNSPAVQALTPATQTCLLTVLQHLLAETGDVNVDQEDIWVVLRGASSLQFGMATGKGPQRAEGIGQGLWAEANLLGEAAQPAHRILLAIQSGTAHELEMDELTLIVEGILSLAGDQAELVFGHGLNPALGESIQVMMLVSRS